MAATTVTPRNDYPTRAVRDRHVRHPSGRTQRLSFLPSTASRGLSNVLLLILLHRLERLRRLCSSVSVAQEWLLSAVHVPILQCPCPTRMRAVRIIAVLFHPVAIASKVKYLCLQGRRSFDCPQALVPCVEWRDSMPPSAPQRARMPSLRVERDPTENSFALF